MRLTYVINSRDRRQTLLRTLSLLPSLTPLPTEDWETFVADHGSTDGTQNAIRNDYRDVKITTSLAQALADCTGDYIVLLDENTHPDDPSTVLAALSILDSNPALAAVVGKLVLPDGAARAPALPGIILSGATCLRKSALNRLDHYHSDLIGDASDFDLSFRLWNASFRVERREEILFRQQNAGDDQPESSSDPAAEMRDTLIVAQRFLPPKLREIYWRDWSMRHRALHAHDGRRRFAAKAALAARLRGWRETFRAKKALTDDALEAIFGLRRQAALVGEWARRNSVWRVVLGNFSENIWATYNACRASGLQMRCIADNQPAFEDLEYRGLPIVPASRAFEGGGIDGAIVTDLNPATIDANFRAIRHTFRGPVLRLWHPPRLAAHAAAA